MALCPQAEMDRMVAMLLSRVVQRYLALLEGPVSEPVILALIGLALLVIAAGIKRRTSLSSLHLQSKAATRARVQIEHIPTVHLRNMGAEGPKVHQQLASD